MTPENELSKLGNTDDDGDASVRTSFSDFTAEEYRTKINTPSSSRRYFLNFHEPAVWRAKRRMPEGGHVNVLALACGYGFELDFIASDTSVDITGTDIDEVMLASAKSRIPRARFIAHDIRKTLPNVLTEQMDVVFLVNAVVYEPLEMLTSARQALRSEGEIIVNFRLFGDRRNDPFFSYYEKDGCLIDTRYRAVGSETFKLRTIDYRAGRNVSMRVLDRQTYFETPEDVVRLARIAGLAVREHWSFTFASLANSNNGLHVVLLAGD